MSADSQTMAERQPSLDICSDEENEGCDGHEKILELELMKSFVPSFNEIVLEKDNLLLDKIKTTCGDILKDITELPSIGSPGKLIAFGPNAIPVFAAEDGRGLCIIASQVGKGRVVLMSSIALGNGILQSKGKDQLVILHENVIQWTGKGKESSGKIDVKNFKNVKLKKINKENEVVFTKDLHLVIERSDEVLQYLNDGGGLIIASQTAVYSEKHGRTLKEGHEFLKAIGVALSTERVFVTMGVIRLKLEEKLYRTLLGLHLEKWLEHCSSYDVKDMVNMPIDMRQMMQNIPIYALKSHHEKIEVIFKKCKDHIAEAIPTPGKPTRKESHKRAIEICTVLTNNGVGFYKAPGIEHFPGDFEEPLPLESAEIEIKSRGMSECHPTGYYLPAGIILRVKVLNKQLPAGWSVRIGAHSDKLYGKRFMKRWPEVVIKCPVYAKEITCFSAYGGGIYFKCPDDKSTKLQVRLQNVVESPLFQLDEPNASGNWDIRKKATGLWADISGKHVRITLPSASVRDIADPTAVMETWDNVLLTQMDLRGIDPEKQKKLWVVFDTQISVGALHSGYPIMGHCGEITNPKAEKFVLNKERLLTTGAWGIYHEFGHNLQKGYWTPQGTREVTCNLFTLYAIEKIAGIPVWEHTKLKSPERLNALKRFFNADAPYEEWKKTAAIALVFYTQLAHAFGWETYKAVFREYESAAVKDLPSKNQDKIDQWMCRFSKHAGVSIGPIMDFWGIPYTAEAENEVQHLTKFLPNDRVTRLAENRVQKIVEKYPNIVRNLEHA